MAEAWSGWAKTVRTIAATESWAVLGTVESRFRMKWTRHRCQAASPMTLEIAERRPSWASEITRRTPVRPRFTSERRKLTQNWWSSLSPVAAPTIVRSPVAVTAIPTTVATEITRPASRTLWKVASS